MTSVASPPANDTLLHSALVYTDTEDYVGAIRAFLCDGPIAGDPALVMAPAPHIDLLRARLGGSCSAMTFLDTAGELRNPRRIIPAAYDFAQAHPGRRIRVVGEPIWHGRSAAEMREVVRHEACVNLIFADVAATVVCPYDASFGADVIDNADRTHPLRFDDGQFRSSRSYVDPAVLLSGKDPLPGPPHDAERIDFQRRDLSSLREVVRDRASRLLLNNERADDLLLAVNELATNTIVHTDGPGVLRIWRDTHTLVCEISDHGHITDPLLGRLPPPPLAESGRGLWLVNQLCDLVELRSDITGTTVRIHTVIG